MDDVQCYQTVREWRWSDGNTCPSCESKHVIKRGFIVLAGKQGR
ncbi:MAG: transposase [Candidatus Tectomicrobia bacterium]|nr:transposase [Candidatus Tectomicrobia bacterium]